MTSETSGTPAGTPHPDAVPPGQSGSDGTSHADLDELGTPPMPPYSSTSGDELNLLLTESLTKPKPDPLLGAFADDEPAAAAEPVAESPAAEARRESFDAVEPLVEPPIVAPSSPERSEIPPTEPRLSGVGADFPIGTGGSFDALDGVAPAPAPSDPAESPAQAGSFDAFAAPAPEAPPTPTPPQPASYDAFFFTPPAELPSLASTSQDAEVAEPPVSPPQPASSDAFPALDLTAPPSAKPEAKPADEEDEDDDDDEGSSRRSSLMMFLLFSYSSALTIGFLWIMITGRRFTRDTDEPDFFPPANTKPDPGQRAGQSRLITPAPPLEPDKIVPLGKTLRMGSLEATPQEITTGPVRLKRSIGRHESRDGGKGALKLKIRLKNVSKDVVFAPLDEAFLRERERDVLDSFIETANGGEIAMYPLAVESEWSIDGQEFRELRPGESFEAIVVTGEGATDRLSPEMTWRVRLRTGIDETDTLGVRFRQGDVRPGS